jgi:hypothetical protein
MLLNPFKTNTPIVSDYSNFKTLREKAVAELLDKEKSIKEELLSKIQEIQMRLASDMETIDHELRDLGIIRSKDDKKRKARTIFQKISDSELKDKLSIILSNGKKVSSTVIFKEAGISRVRLNQFTKGNRGFLVTEGNRRSMLYFLA